MLLHAVLHFNDEVSSFIGGAVDVENNFSCILGQTNVLVVLKFERGYAKLTFEQVVKKADEQVLCYFLSENVFEASVCKRVNIAGHNVRC